MLSVLCLAPSLTLHQSPRQSRLYQSPRRAVGTASMNFLDDFISGVSGGGDYPPAVVESKVTRLKFSTSAGDFTVEVDRALSPSGVDRLLDLVSSGFFDNQILYRVIPGFLVQMGVAADPNVHAQWDQAEKRLPDEPNRAPFRRGTLSFAGTGLNSRTCHMFIALEPHGRQLGKAAHEAALGRVDDAGLEVLDTIVKRFEATGYPDVTGLQGALVDQGNGAAAAYPGLDYIVRVEEERLQ